MTAEQMWKEYSAKSGTQAAYEAWAFGAEPDVLAQLVLSGTKTATAGAAHWYDTGAEPMPKAGDYSVVLSSKDEAVCIIQTTKVYVTPFSQVSQEQAWKEGEGDRSLAYWRDVHRDFFTRELAEAGLTFEEEMPIVCEEFVLVYP